MLQGGLDPWRWSVTQYLWNMGSQVQLSVVWVATSRPTLGLAGTEESQWPTRYSMGDFIPT